MARRLPLPGAGGGVGAGDVSPCNSRRRALRRRPLLAQTCEILLGRQPARLGAFGCLRAIGRRPRGVGCGTLRVAGHLLRRGSRASQLLEAIDGGRMTLAERLQERRRFDEARVRRGRSGLRIACGFRTTGDHLEAAYWRRRVRRRQDQAGKRRQAGKFDLGGELPVRKSPLAAVRRQGLERGTHLPEDGIAAGLSLLGGDAFGLLHRPAHGVVAHAQRLADVGGGVAEQSRLLRSARRGASVEHGVVDRLRPPEHLVDEVGGA